MPTECNITYSVKPPRRYGLGRFLLDVFLVCITGGLWLVWMLFRFLRSK